MRTGITSGAAKRRWLWATGALVPAAAMLVWLIPSDDPRSPTVGQVKIAAPRPSATATTVSKAPMAPIPVVPTRENGRKAQDQSLIVAYEQRDADWAPKSEAAIQGLLRALPYIGRDRILNVKCALSACEVTGIVQPDPETGALKAIWEAIERDTAGAELRAHGLERTAAIFDTGRSAGEFQIYYHRVERPTPP